MRFWYLTLMRKKPARIQDFFSGGWGPGLTPENSLDNIFFSPQLCCCCFVALRPKSTAMVIAGRSVHLTTLFPGQA